MLRPTTTPVVYSKGCSDRSNRRRRGVASRTPLLAAAAAMVALLTAASVVAACVMALTSLGIGPTTIDSDQQYQWNTSAGTADSHANATDAEESEWLQSNVTHLVAVAAAAETADGPRYRPSSFLPESEILNETVHCDEPTEGDLDTFYKAPTWLCKNIRVGERRLPFCDATLRTSNELVLLRRMDLDGDELFREMCGHLPDRRNNDFLLCELLLAELASGSLAVPPVASSVHVPYGNCSLPERRRAVLVGNAASTTSYSWHIESRPRPGFVTDLLCSFAVQQQH